MTAPRWPLSLSRARPKLQLGDALVPEAPASQPFPTANRAFPSPPGMSAPVPRSCARPKLQLGAALVPEAPASLPFPPANRPSSSPPGSNGAPAGTCLRRSEKSSKNKPLYFTQSVQSRLEKCSSCGSLLCVENSSASRTGEVVLLPHAPESSSAIAARLCALRRDLIISNSARPLAFTHPAREARPFIRTPRSENPEKPNQNAKIASSRSVSSESGSETPFSEHAVRKIPAKIQKKVHSRGIARRHRCGGGRRKSPNAALPKPMDHSPQISQIYTDFILRNVICENLRNLWLKLFAENRGLLNQSHESKRRKRTEITSSAVNEMSARLKPNRKAQLFSYSCHSCNSWTFLLHEYS